MAFYRFRVKDSNSKQKGTRTKANEHCDYVSREGKYAPLNTKAEAHSDYVTRKGAFSEDKYEDLVHGEHFNMPGFAKDNPKYFWECAEKFESPSIITYKEFEVALPHEFSDEKNIEIAKNFCNECFGSEFVYSLGIHRKPSSTGEIENIHFHVMFSERELDGIERTPEKFFKKANKKNPEKGGAAKNPKWNKYGFISDYRKKWETFINKELELAGLEILSCETLNFQKLEAMKSEDYARAELLDRFPIDLNGTIMIKLKQKGINSLTKSERIDYEKYLVAKEIKTLKEKTYLERTNNNVQDNYVQYLENRTVETYLKNKLSFYQEKLSPKNNLTTEEREVYTNLLLYTNETLEKLRDKKEFSSTYSNINSLSIKNLIQDDKNSFEELRKFSQDYSEIFNEVEKLLNTREELFINDSLVSNNEITNLKDIMKKLEIENDRMCKYNFLEQEKLKIISKLDDKNIKSIAVSKLSETEKKFYTSHILTNISLEPQEKKYKNQILNKIIRSSERIKGNYQKKLSALSKQQEEYKNYSDIRSLTKNLNNSDRISTYNLLSNQYVEDIKKYNEKIDTLKIIQMELQKDSKTEKIILDFEKKISKVKDYVVDVKEKGYNSVYLNDIKTYGKENNSDLHDKLSNSKSLELKDIELILTEKYNELIKKEKYSEAARKSRINNQINSLYSNIEITNKKMDTIKEVLYNELEKTDNKNINNVEAPNFENKVVSNDNNHSNIFKNKIAETIAIKSHYDLVEYKMERINTILSSGDTLEDKLKVYYENNLENLTKEKTIYSFNISNFEEICSHMSNEEKKSLSIELQNKYNNNINLSSEKIKMVNSEINYIETESDYTKNIASLLKEKEEIKKEFFNSKTDGDYSKCLNEIKALEIANSQDKNDLAELNFKIGKKNEYEKIELDNFTAKRLEKCDVELNFYEEKKAIKIKELKNELKDHYSEIKLSNLAKSNINKHISYINYVFEDRKDILEYKENQDSYSIMNKLELENKMLSRYLYLEEMKNNIKATLEDENKIMNSVLSRLDKDNQKIYENFIIDRKEPINNEQIEEKTKLEDKINHSISNLKNYYEKKVNDLSKEQEFYVSKNNLKDILKTFSTENKNNYINSLIEKNNTHIGESIKQVDVLKNKLIQIDNNPTINTFISKLETNKKEVKSYAVNLKTEGKYFKCIKEIDNLKSTKETNSKNKNERLETLTKLKIEYEKLDTKNLEIKLSEKYDSIINKYQKTKDESIKNIKSELQKVYTDIKVTQLSTKSISGQMEKANTQAKGSINISGSGAKIYGAINMNESKKKKEKDSATKLVTSEVDGIEY